MNYSEIFYAAVLMFGIFLSAISQTMLKKAAMKTYRTRLGEYLNILVVSAYFIFMVTTLISVYAYRGLTLSLGLVLESTSYIYVTIFGVTLFKEKLNLKKVAGLVLIMGGIIVYALLG